VNKPLEWTVHSGGGSLCHKKSRVDKFAEYKSAREGGKRVFKVSFCIQSEPNTHSRRVKKRAIRFTMRLLKINTRAWSKDFVVDDGPAGYANNEMDDWVDGNELKMKMRSGK